MYHIICKNGQICLLSRGRKNLVISFYSFTEIFVKIPLSFYRSADRLDELLLI